MKLRVHRAVFEQYIETKKIYVVLKKKMVLPDFQIIKAKIFSFRYLFTGRLIFFDLLQTIFMIANTKSEKIN